MVSRQVYGALPPKNDEKCGSEQPIEKYPNASEIIIPLCLLVEGNKEDKKTSVHLVGIRMEELGNKLEKKYEDDGEGDSDT